MKTGHEYTAHHNATCFTSSSTPECQDNEDLRTCHRYCHCCRQRFCCRSTCTCVAVGSYASGSGTWCGEGSGWKQEGAVLGRWTLGWTWLGRRLGRILLWRLGRRLGPGLGLGLVRERMPNESSRRDHALNMSARHPTHAAQKIESFIPNWVASLI